ncbi:hypothetical protein FH972_011617 [Carpinus fangiana]|uniref:Uncharacterized protein n=1 Tax=Carpinus fangiana TaxID=176857 RepID=A0A660KXX3_9ROSI|nr:hypothetical protein FH972_011617 [Carpinus fangiana]
MGEIYIPIYPVWGPESECKMSECEPYMESELGREGACKILDPSMENRTGMGKSFGKRRDRESCKKTYVGKRRGGDEAEGNVFEGKDWYFYKGRWFAK